MPQREFERKLVAILYADVAGYSRLTGANEEGTHQLLSRYLDTMENLVSLNHGKIVHYAGDAILAEFTSVFNAMDAAVSIQSSLAEMNSEIEEDARVEFRIGVNLGDVMIDRGDIFGNGVNIAARLEAMAEPGGIWISHTVFEQIEGKVQLNLEDMGDFEVKNIKKPVHAYRVNTGQEPQQATSNNNEIDTPKTYEKPSIAVLPLDNMSGDEDQNYFADGISEDIISDLSRYPTLSVIARNSSFAFKGKAINIQEIGKGLRADYVVEGSVRKSGNKVRINVQLIDVNSGAHLWADRYDRELEDVFAVQDEITKMIVAILPGRIEAADAELVRRKHPANMHSHDYFLRGRYYHNQGSPEDNALGIKALEKSIELDPNNAAAYAELSCIFGQAWVRGYLPEEDSFPYVESFAEKSFEVDENDVNCHRILCEIRSLQCDFEKSEFHHHRAYALNPNDPHIVSQKGEMLMWQGKPDEGLEWIETSNQLDPFAPDGRAFAVARCHFTAKRYSDAVKFLNKVSKLQLPQYIFLTASHIYLDQMEKAEEASKKVIELSPEFSVSGYIKKVPYRNTDDIEHLREALVKAGLPQ